MELAAWLMAGNFLCPQAGTATEGFDCELGVLVNSQRVSIKLAEQFKKAQEELASNGIYVQAPVSRNKEVEGLLCKVCSRQLHLLLAFHIAQSTGDDPYLISAIVFRESSAQATVKTTIPHRLGGGVATGLMQVTAAAAQDIGL